MRKTLLSLLSFSLATSASFGAAGIFDAFVFVSTDGTSPTQFYDIGATTANADFQGNDLGTYDVNSDVLHFGGQQKTFKGNGTDVTSSSLFYRVYATGSPSGAFLEVSQPFQIDNVGGTSGDQQWGGDVVGFNSTFTVSGNVLSGLSNGDYTVEVYSRITTNGTDASTEIFNSNLGSNYSATFTAVPEPSSILLGSIGALALLRRRR